MRRRTALQLGTLFGTIGLAFVMVQVWIMPSHDSFRPLAELGRRASATIPADAVVYLMFLPESQVHFYIDRPLRQRHSRDLYKDGANPTDVTLPVASEPYYIMTSIDFSPAVNAAATPSPIIARAIKSDRKPVDIAKSPAPAAASKSRTLWTRRGPKRSNNIPTGI